MSCYSGIGGIISSRMSLLWRRQHARRCGLCANIPLHLCKKSVIVNISVYVIKMWLKKQIRSLMMRLPAKDFHWRNNVLATDNIVRWISVSSHFCVSSLLRRSMFLCLTNVCMFCFLYFLYLCSGSRSYDYLFDLISRRRLLSALSPLSSPGKHYLVQSILLSTVHNIEIHNKLF